MLAPAALGRQRWKLVPVLGPPGGREHQLQRTRVGDIVALAADDVWFGGRGGEPNSAGPVTWHPLAMHWDGSSLGPPPAPGAFIDAHAIYTG